MAWLLVSADVVWVAVSVVVGFPSRLETIFQTLVAALTLAMLFVIQHTQAREQAVTQRKLDELLAAVPRADASLIGLEDAADDEIADIHAAHVDARERALEPD